MIVDIEQVHAGAVSDQGRDADRAMERYADGEGSFEDLYDAVAPRLKRFLRRRLGSARSVNDIVGSVMLELHRARASYVHGAGVLPWTFAIARRLSRTEETPIARSAAYADAESGTLDLFKSMSQLPENLRPVWELICLEGFTFQQAAEALGLSRSILRERALRADDIMRDALGDDAETTEDPRPVSRRTYGGPVDEDLSGLVALGRFRVQGEIGRGGMGTVHRAENLELRRVAAVKVLKRELCDDPQTVARFEQEAVAVAEIKHPNIVEISGYGMLETGQWCYAMEYLVGESLSDRLKRERRLAWSQVKWIVQQICDGLEAVHTEGIVHRDIKPANCFLLAGKGGKDIVKLLDFGVAKVPSRESLPPELHTRPGVLLGTPDYMAPEQFRGRPVDGRVDLYAVGVMMYEMLAGRRPFMGGAPIAVATQHMYEQPMPLHNHVDVSSHVDAIVACALAKEPADRFARAADLREAVTALDDEGRGRRTFSHARPAPSRVKLVLAGASAAVTLGGVFGAAVLAPSRVRRAPVGPLLARQHIEPVVAEARPGIAACRSRFGAAEDTLSFELTVLGATGRVIDSKAAGAHEHTELGRCGADVLFELRFPTFTDEAGEQKIPVEL